MKSIIAPCTCAHESQDAIHGKGKRVKNPRKKAAGQKPEYRCTVCGKISES